MKVTQSCPTLCNLMDYTVHGILQATILEWVAFPFSRGSSQSRDRTQVSRIAGRFFTSWATREAQMNPQMGTQDLGKYGTSWSMTPCSSWTRVLWLCYYTALCHKNIKTRLKTALTLWNKVVNICWSFAMSPITPSALLPEWFPSGDWIYGNQLSSGEGAIWL